MGQKRHTAGLIVLVIVLLGGMIFFTNLPSTGRVITGNTVASTTGQETSFQTIRDITGVSEAEADWNVMDLLIQDLGPELAGDASAMLGTLGFEPVTTLQDIAQDPETLNDFSTAYTQVQTAFEGQTTSTGAGSGTGQGQEKSTTGQEGIVLDTTQDYKQQLESIYSRTLQDYDTIASAARPPFLEGQTYQDYLLFLESRGIDAGMTIGDVTQDTAMTEQILTDTNEFLAAYGSTGQIPTEDSTTTIPSTDTQGSTTQTNPTVEAVTLDQVPEEDNNILNAIGIGQATVISETVDSQELDANTVADITGDTQAAAQIITAIQQEGITQENIEITYNKETGEAYIHTPTTSTSGNVEREDMAIKITTTPTAERQIFVDDSSLRGSFIDRIRDSISLFFGGLLGSTGGGLGCDGTPGAANNQCTLGLCDNGQKCTSVPLTEEDRRTGAYAPAETHKCGCVESSENPDHVPTKPETLCEADPQKLEGEETVTERGHRSLSSCLTRGKTLADACAAKIREKYEGLDTLCQQDCKADGERCVPAKLQGYGEVCEYYCKRFDLPENNYPTWRLDITTPTLPQELACTCKGTTGAGTDSKGGGQKPSPEPKPKEDPEDDNQGTPGQCPEIAFTKESTFEGTHTSTGSTGYTESCNAAANKALTECNSVRDAVVAGKEEEKKQECIQAGGCRYQDGTFSATKCALIPLEGEENAAEPSAVSVHSYCQSTGQTCNFWGGGGLIGFTPEEQGPFGTGGQTAYNCRYRGTFSVTAGFTGTFDGQCVPVEITTTGTVAAT